MALSLLTVVATGSFKSLDPRRKSGLLPWILLTYGMLLHLVGSSLEQFRTVGLFPHTERICRPTVVSRVLPKKTVPVILWPDLAHQTHIFSVYNSTSSISRGFPAARILEIWKLVQPEGLNRASFVKARNVKYSRRIVKEVLKTLAVGRTPFCLCGSSKCWNAVTLDGTNFAFLTALWHVEYE